LLQPFIHKRKTGDEEVVTALIGGVALYTSDAKLSIHSTPMKNPARESTAGPKAKLQRR